MDLWTGYPGGLEDVPNLLAVVFRFGEEDKAR